MLNNNSRDNVEWDEAQENQAQSQVCEHVKTKMPADKADDLENNANQYWDKFYSVHQEKYVLLSVIFHYLMLTENFKILINKHFILFSLKYNM